MTTNTLTWTHRGVGYYTSGRYTVRSAPSSHKRPLWNLSFNGRKVRTYDTMRDAYAGAEAHANNRFTVAEAQSFALGHKADSHTARRFGDWVQAVQNAYPETLETHWADFCQARYEEANDI